MLNFISEYVDSKRKIFENYDRQISKERAKLPIKKRRFRLKLERKVSEEKMLNKIRKFTLKPLKTHRENEQ